MNTWTRIANASKSLLSYGLRHAEEDTTMYKRGMNVTLTKKKGQESKCTSVIHN